MKTKRLLLVVLFPLLAVVMMLCVMLPSLKVGHDPAIQRSGPQNLADPRDVRNLHIR